MENAYTRAVIILVTGAQLPGEHFNEYLLRFSGYTGIHYDTARVGWYGTRPLSKNAKEQFDWAAQHVGQPNELIAYTEHHLNVWKMDPARHRNRIDAARRFLDDLQRYDEGAGADGVPARNRDVRVRGRTGGAAAAPALAAAASAAKA